MSKAEDWRTQLASIATLAPGWFDRIGRGSNVRWGVPPDEGALTTARRLLEQVDATIGRATIYCNADPGTGDICLNFWGDDGTLSVYVEAGLVCQMMAYCNPLPGFTIDRDETPFPEALAIIRNWLGGK